MIERGFTDDAAAFNAPVVLRNGERIFLANFRDLYAFDRLSIGNDGSASASAVSASSASRDKTVH